MSLVEPSVSEELKFTYSDYLLLPDNGKKYEVLDGELIMSPSPSPVHQNILLNLATILKLFVEQNDLGKIFIAPCDVVLSEYDVVQPDIIFIAKQNEHIIGESHIHGSPDLIVEIFSPHSVKFDCDIKRKIYSRHCIQEYWMVDPTAQKVQVLRLQQGSLRLTMELSSNDTLNSPFFPGLNIKLQDIFSK